MGLTRFPNGVTVSSGTAFQYNASAGDGSIDCNNLFVASTANSAISVGGGITMGTSTALKFIGERAYIPFSFTSAAVTTYYAVPFAGQIIDCWVTADTTPRTCSAFTLYANGTGGTVCVASVATLVYATAIGQQVQPALTPATQGVATGLAIVVTTAGTACNFQGMVVLQRTS